MGNKWRMMIQFHSDPLPDPPDKQHKGTIGLQGIFKVGIDHGTWPFWILLPGSVMRYDELKPTKNQVETWDGGIYGGICSSEQCGFSSPQLTTFAWITHQLKQCTVCNWLRRICTSITCHRTIGRYRTNPSTSQPMGNEIHKLFETPLALIFDSGPQQMGGPQTSKEWSYPSERWL